MSDIDKYLNKITCIDALELLADLPDDFDKFEKKVEKIDE